MTIMEQLPHTVHHYLNHLETKGRKLSTIRRYGYDLSDFYRYVEVTVGSKAVEEPNQLPRQLFENYFRFLQRERGYKLRTLKRIQTVLLRYLSYLVDINKLKQSPLSEPILDKHVFDELQSKDLLSKKEVNQLMASILNDAGLSEKQQAVRPLLAPRNLVIISLFLYYGLRMNEVSMLNTEHLNLSKRRLKIPDETGNSRTLPLSRQTQQHMYTYLRAIPSAVRPKNNGDPLFVAFDFQRQTYRWSYEADQPKRLTEVAIQKMIRTENQRANIREGLSSQHYRHTYIIRCLEAGYTLKDLQDRLGLLTPLSLLRYARYIEQTHHK